MFERSEASCIDLRFKATCQANEVTNENEIPRGTAAAHAGTTAITRFSLDNSAGSKVYGRASQLGPRCFRTRPQERFLITSARDKHQARKPGLSALRFAQEVHRSGSLRSRKSLRMRPKVRERSSHYDQAFLRGVCTLTKLDLLMSGW